MKKSYIIRTAVTGLLLTGLVCLIAAMTLHSFSAVIGLAAPKLGADEVLCEKLVNVFDGLKNASLSLPWYITLILCVSAAAGPEAVRIRKWKIWVKIPVALLAVIITAAAYLLTVWYAYVNGIRFSDVMTSLYRMINAGALDAL